MTQVLEHRPQAAGAARQVARSVLEGWRVDARTADVVVLVVCRRRRRGTRRRCQLVRGVAG
ncbi:hypothetical protein ACFYW6_38220 [Streptomyces sp. NPDC002659]|uniref:hypothetical protein n=1 Tax=Streptomyces sp. NPDC002659 TaxID=3364656 RepID=UPI003699D6A2